MLTAAPTTHLLSASQIDTFNMCQRKWGYRYIDAIEAPPSSAARFGSEVHEVIAGYLSNKAKINTESRAGQVLKPGLIFLPTDIPQENIERYFEFTAQGQTFRGYIDYCKQLNEQTWLIGDHKTCSSFSTALPAHELKKNTQANIYAQWAFQEMGAKTVKLNWIYYRTKGKPEARLVEAEIKNDEASQFFEPQLKIAGDISELAQKTTRASELPKNTSACFKYGPCHFLARCKYGAESAKADFLFKGSEHLSKANEKAFHLFVDCVPTKSEFSYERTIELSDLLKPVLAQIQTEKELPHYRLAGYGQHVGLIANYLSRHLQDTAYNERTAILSSVKTPEGCDTLQTLSSAAGRVVRGF